MSHARVEGPKGRSGSETLGGMLHQRHALQHRPRGVRAFGHRSPRRYPMGSILPPGEGCMGRRDLREARMGAVRALSNPLAATWQNLDPAGRAPLDFHRRLPEYAATPLVDAPGLAGALGVGKVWVKDESWRLGLPAFKILGASWAVYRALEQRSGGIGEWGDVEELRGRLAPLLPLTLAAATDGNHGRAVARMARMLGLGARIFVPADMAPARIEAIRSEGAEVLVVRGTYDEAVARSAEEADGRCLVISDTSWPGYEDVDALGDRWLLHDLVGGLGRARAARRGGTHSGRPDRGRGLRSRHHASLPFPRRFHPDRRSWAWSRPGPPARSPRRGPAA
jgi:pyridoxal-phosphate dependent enzyme